MPMFRRKAPLFSEAVQFKGDNFFEIAAFIGRGPEVLDNLELKSTDNPVVDTFDGPKEMMPGDWVVRVAISGFWVLSPNVFESAYEPVQP